MSFDWLLIPMLILFFGTIAYLVYRRESRKDWHENALRRHYRDKNRAEDRSRDYG